MKVNIIDLGSGNIRSLKNWIEKANITASCINNINDLDAEIIILPGVGEIGSYMKRLKRESFDKAILNHVKNGGRLIGICLGFQIMSIFSEESGGVKGLGLIKAETKRLKGNISHNEWEPLLLRKDSMTNQSFNSTEKLSRKTVLKGRVFYNHEYGVINKDSKAFTIPISSKLKQYTGLFVKDKIIGIQFHPEKSQITGKNLISMIL
jgi:imidazole glycerol-phosphate synthase subunit HisH